MLVLNEPRLLSYPQNLVPPSGGGGGGASTATPKTVDDPRLVVGRTTVTLSKSNSITIK